MEPALTALRIVKADGSYHNLVEGAIFYAESPEFSWIPTEAGYRDMSMHLILDLAVVGLVGFLFGEIAGRLRLPRLIGMIAVGMVLGPHLLNLISPALLGISSEARMLALLIILLRAGLGLDKEKILSQGTVALRLGFMPALVEAAVLAVATRLIFGWDWLLCWLLGWIVCAASPAVIVPMMLYLKSRGWGQDKGIPDLILAGGTMSDATAITMFGITLSWLADGVSGLGAWQAVSIPVEVAGGILLGYMAGKLAHFLVHRTRLTTHVTQDLLIVLSTAMALVVGQEILPYSGFLAVMVMGFTVLETDRVLARRIRVESEKIWTVAQIFLFVLIGAAVNLNVIAGAGLRGLAVILIGLVVGRWLGILASTMGSSITLPERAFMAVGDMAKATVQAAIGGIPLALGLPHGEEILAIAVLSILVTAPAGALGTALLAPRILQRGPVDPTRVTVNEEQRFLVALDGSGASLQALKRAASASRQSDGEILALHVSDEPRPPALDPLKEALELTAGDIPHRLMVRRGNPAETIVEIAESREVNYIFMGKGNRSGVERLLVGDVARMVIESTEIPVILVDSGGNPGHEPVRAIP